MGRPAALVDADWPDQALQALELLVHWKEFVTAEDLREVIGAPENGNQIGPVFARAAKLKIITKADYRASRNKSRRGGALHVWTLHPSQRNKEKKND